MDYESSKTWAFLCTLPHENEIRFIAEECASNSYVEIDLLSNFFCKSIDEIISILKEIILRLDNWKYILDPIEPVPKHKCYKSLTELYRNINFSIAPFFIDVKKTGKV